MPRPEVRELITCSLAYASDDLRAAEALESNEIPAKIISATIICFHTQQPAEKAMKAVFVREHVDFPYAHDLVRLAEALPPGWKVDVSDADLADLSRWAVESRYPMRDEPSSADADRALRMVRATVGSLRCKIATGAEVGDD
jgi:HEPN domain-containing protein